MLEETRTRITSKSNKSKPPILTIHPQQLLQTPHPPHLRPPQSPQSPFTSEIVEGVINSLHPPQFIASSFSSSINQKFIPERIRPNRIRDGDGDNEEKFLKHSFPTVYWADFQLPQYQTSTA